MKQNVKFDYINERWSGKAEDFFHPAYLNFLHRESVFNGDIDEIGDALKKYNGWINDEDDLFFNTEKDLAWFLLKFS